MLFRVVKSEIFSTHKQKNRKDFVFKNKKCIFAQRKQFGTKIDLMLIVGS